MAIPNKLVIEHGKRGRVGTSGGRREVVLQSMREIIRVAVHTS